MELTALAETLGDAEDEVDDPRFRDVTPKASWSVSSAKVGNGVKQLLDGDKKTCWQSDGVAPHHIVASFPHRVFVEEVRVLVNYELDESYTPSEILVRLSVGLLWEDMEVVHVKEQHKGWVRIPFDPGRGVFALHILILANHQGGKDTHVRGVKVLGSEHRQPATMFSSGEFSQASVLR